MRALTPGETRHLLALLHPERPNPKGMHVPTLNRLRKLGLVEVRTRSFMTFHGKEQRERRYRTVVEGWYLPSKGRDVALSIQEN